MRLKCRWIITIMGLLALVSVFSFSGGNAAAVADWQKGASITPRSSTDFASDSFKQSLSNLAATNANFVTLIIPYKQSNIFATDIQRSGATPTDEALIEGIKYAHSLGLKVNLKPHLGTSDGEWRAEINPADRAAWFRGYRGMLNHYARIAKEHNVEQITLGAELINMAAATFNSTNTGYWRDMIKSVRAIYSGKLTYSANWGESGWVNEKDNIEFWDDLDYIGIAAYFEFSRPYDKKSLREEWDSWNATHITPLYKKYNKPILFTEIGYRSILGALAQPWNWGIKGEVNETEQADGYEALLSYWNDYSYMEGVHLWEWNSDPNAGGPGTTNYTPQHKKAQQVMTNWFGSKPSAPAPAPKFSASGTGSPSSPVTNESVSIAVDVANSGSTVNQVLVDIEIHNSANKKVYQRIFANQDFNAGQSKTYRIDWTAPGSGDYALMVGMFSAGWGVNYSWENAGSVTVKEATSDIQIEQPTGWTSLPEIQPFKCTLANPTLPDYTRYWRGGGADLTGMYKGNLGYQYKAAKVDLLSWRCHGPGADRANFAAKDLGDSIMREPISRPSLGLQEAFVLGPLRQGNPAGRPYRTNLQAKAEEVLL